MNAVENAVTNATATVNAPAQPLAPLGDLPGIPAGPSDAEKAALLAKELEERKLKEANALTRFDSTIGFKLEGEVVGALKRKVSKSGGVRVAMATKKELSVISGGKKGLELDAFSRLSSDELKSKQSVLAARLSGDNNWTGAAMVLSAKGDKITLEYKKASPMTVSVSEPTDEAIAKALGKTLDEVKAMKLESKRIADDKARMEAEIRAKVEKAIADEMAAKELAAEEAARIAHSAQSNGAVSAPEEKSDNDTE